MRKREKQLRAATVARQSGCGRRLSLPCNFTNRRSTVRSSTRTFALNRRCLPQPPRQAKTNPAFLLLPRPTPLQKGLPTSRKRRRRTRRTRRKRKKRTKTSLQHPRPKEKGKAVKETSLLERRARVTRAEAEATPPRDLQRSRG